MKFKSFLLILLCFSLILCVCACQTSSSVENKKIAVIVKAVDSDFWHNVENGVNSAAVEYNVSVTFSGPLNEEDYKTQNDMIYGAIRDGVDAIVLSAISYTENSDAVNEAVKNGIKVVTVDSGVDSGNVSLFIGTDNFEAGRQAAKAALDGFSGEKIITVGLLNFAAGTDNGIQREAGFREYASSVPGVKILDTVTADSNLTSATREAVSLLAANPGIDVIVGFNEWMTLGVGSAVKQLGLSDKVRAIGFDTNIASVGMIETGEMDALVVQNPFAMGYLSVKYAAALIRGEMPDGPILYTDVFTVTRDNLFDSDTQKLVFGFK